ncbi:unnamed protein product [Orchesella dallaii]|uniref:Cullin N-terminal domain-containing protein n=1 Tax=Orchesella dallaii TaxID=48710 RepID=A0ABP1R6Z4_9HEXA
MNLNQFLQILKQQSESTAFEEIWQWLSSKVTALLGGGSLSPSSFDEIYTKVFNACIYQKRPDVLYERLKEHLQQYLVQVVKKGDELFQKETDDQALRFYIKTWEVYKHGSESVGNTFLYLSSFHVGKGLQLFPIRHLALLTWKEVVIEKHYEQWTTTILNLITSARNGEELNHNAIHSGSGLFSEFDCLLEYIVKHPRDTTPSSSIIGMAQPDAGGGVKRFNTRFEKRFVEESSLFYSNENLVRYENLTQYQNEIEKIVLLEETIGEALLLHDVTLESHIKMCKNVQKALLQNYWAEYMEEFTNILFIKKTEIVKRVYTLLNSLEMTNELDEMKECFLNHLNSDFQQYTFAHQNVRLC